MEEHAADLKALEEGGEIRVPTRREKKPLPKTLPVFPLTNRPFFQGLVHTITIEKGPYYDIITKLLQGDKEGDNTVALLLTQKGEIDVANLDKNDLYEKGLVGHILKTLTTDNGYILVMMVGDRIEANLSKGKMVDSVLMVPVKTLAEKGVPKPGGSSAKDMKHKAWVQQIISDVKLLVEKYKPMFVDDFKEFLRVTNIFDETEIGKVADFAVGYTTASKEELQKVIECIDVEKRAEMVHALLLKEVEVNKLQSEINKSIEVNITAQQREFFLREQLKAIKKELGLEKDAKTTDEEEFRERIKDQKLPEEAEKVIEEELGKLATLDPQSAEYNITRTYLDWLTVVPWDLHSEEQHNVSKARKVLEEDHYGLEDIKKRILEFIAVGKLSGGVKGSIICLVGPPGVGKTSIGKSIARALGREFYRFSVGGMRDEAEIKGHRRTYVGAMPGKMLQALKTTGVNNPVIMLDEIDKLQERSFQGDPASALLEVLDPEQNKNFLDHYLDVRFDLSNILFITTANVLETIPEPLRDRMDTLRIPGYLTDEKVEIATQYLVPRNMEEMGLKAKDLSFHKSAIKEMINGYAREAGVRNLENSLKKIMRQCAMKQVEAQESKLPRRAPKFKISPKNLNDFLGKPVFTSDRIFKVPPVGVATGLAWTAMGGAVLYIEAIKMPSKEKALVLTGQLGDVMKESSQIAYSYVNSIFQHYVPKGEKFFEGEFGLEKVHVHVPEGATPKDGPSAGITIAVALLSLITGKKMRNDVGMTGELTLTGKVLPIGGLREKVLAAKRSGLKKIVCSIQNERDWDELTDELKKGMDVKFVENCKEVFEYVFNFKK